MKNFFVRTCGTGVNFEVVAEEGVRLVDMVDAISGQISRSPRSIVLIHFPIRDIESGVSVSQLLRIYKKILDVCARVGSICIVGGQQPVNSFSQDNTDRQLELERQASAIFGRSYLPIYNYFQSEARGRRLMSPLDSGDGRHLYDSGHEVLYLVYRRRLLETLALAP